MQGNGSAPMDEIPVRQLRSEFYKAFFMKYGWCRRLMVVCAFGHLATEAFVAVVLFGLTVFERSR
jgi:hypothetical protein